MEVRVSPEQEPHTSPRGQGHCHHGALLGRDVGDGGSGGTRQQRGVDGQLSKNMKFKDISN